MDPSPVRGWDDAVTLDEVAEVFGISGKGEDGSAVGFEINLAKHFPADGPIADAQDELVTPAIGLADRFHDVRQGVEELDCALGTYPSQYPGGILLMSSLTLS